MGSSELNRLRGLDEAARSMCTTVTGLAEPSDDEMRRSFALTSRIELPVDTVSYRARFGSDFIADFLFVEKLLELGALGH